MVVSHCFELGPQAVIPSVTESVAVTYPVLCFQKAEYSKCGCSIYCIRHMIRRIFCCSCTRQNDTKQASSVQNTGITSEMISSQIISGWWFGTCGLFVPSYWKCHHPNWRTPSFSRGVGRKTTNQICLRLSSPHVVWESDSPGYPLKRPISAGLMEQGLFGSVRGPWSGANTSQLGSFWGWRNTFFKAIS